MKIIKAIALAAMAIFCTANVAHAGLNQKDAVNLELIQEKLHKQDRWCEAMGALAGGAKYYYDRGYHFRDYLRVKVLFAQKISVTANNVDQLETMRGLEAMRGVAATGWNMALDGYDAQYIKEAAVQACKYDIDKFYEDAYTFFDD